MVKILTYEQIDQHQWQELVQSSATATWFQTPEAYKFYASVEEMLPFAVGVVESQECDSEAMGYETSETESSVHTPSLKGVCVGYITKETNTIKQYLTCRAIIIGGPLLAEDISATALAELLNAVAQCKVESVKCNDMENSSADPNASTPYTLHPTQTEASTPYTLHPTPIYIESRNFHDYSKWRNIFEANGFAYQPHLNFHVDTSSIEVVDKNLGKSRKRDIRTTIRDGVTPVYQPTIEQVKQYYQILQNLYATKVKTPLFSWNFFEQLHRTEHARFILTEYQGRIIGGTVCVELPNRALYEWFACGEDGVYDHIYPSCYATYLGIKYAAESGCQIFDMMGAGKPEEAYGVRDFKAKFGGELVEHGRFLCVRKPLLYWIGKTGVKLLKRK